jgi:hypothetical protein
MADISLNFVGAVDNDSVLIAPTIQKKNLPLSDVMIIVPTGIFTSKSSKILETT